MATLTKPQHRLLTIASVSGIIQGLAWFVMSLICIILYLDSVNSAGRLPPESQSYALQLEWAIYMYLLWGNSPSDTLMTPHSFTIFMWIYLIASTLWIVVSALQLRTINQATGNPVNLIKCWGVLTCLISLVDFLLVVLLGAENSQYCAPIVPNLIVEAICTNVLMTVLVVAARGFLLWIINVIFIYVTFRILKTIRTGKNLDRKLLAVNNSTIPRASLYASPKGNMRPNQAPPNMGPNGGNVWPNQQTSVPSSNTSTMWANQPRSPVNNNSDNFWPQNPKPVMSYDPRSPPPRPGATYFSEQQQPFGRY